MDECEMKEESVQVCVCQWLAFVIKISCFINEHKTNWKFDFVIHNNVNTCWWLLSSCPPSIAFFATLKLIAAAMECFNDFDFGLHTQLRVRLLFAFQNNKMHTWRLLTNTKQFPTTKYIHFDKGGNVEYKWSHRTTSYLQSECDANVKGHIGSTELRNDMSLNTIKTA